MVAHACHPRTWEAEEGLGIQGNPHLHDIPGPTRASWELVPRIKPKENPRQPPLPGRAHTEPFPWGCGPLFFLEGFFHLFLFFTFVNHFTICVHMHGGQRRTPSSGSLSPRWDPGLDPARQRRTPRSCSLSPLRDPGLDLARQACSFPC